MWYEVMQQLSRGSVSSTTFLLNQETETLEVTAKRCGSKQAALWGNKRVQRYLTLGEFQIGVASWSMNDSYKAMSLITENDAEWLH